MNTELIIKVAGWIGLFLIVLAYFLLSKKKMKSGSFWYHLMNLIGGLGVLVSSVFFRSWELLVFSLILSIIAVYIIVKIVTKPAVYKELK